MTNKYVAVSDRYDGQVVDIHLGPPPGNIISMGLVGELSAVIDRLEENSQVNRRRKLIVITGEGKHFSFGASVEEHRPEFVEQMLPKFHALIAQILRCRIPTLAMVSGQCLGGGFELALSCSMIFATEDARLGVPEIQLGVFPPAAVALLPCKTGDSIVCEMVLSGESCPADMLHRLGIVNRVVPRATFDDTLSGFIEKHMLPKSASSLRIACAAARRSICETFEANIAAAEKLYLKDLMSTSDAVEGVSAFLEKRTPRWADE